MARRAAVFGGRGDERLLEERRLERWIAEEDEEIVGDNERREGTGVLDEDAVELSTCSSSVSSLSVPKAHSSKSSS